MDKQSIFTAATNFITKHNILYISIDRQANLFTIRELKRKWFNCLSHSFTDVCIYLIFVRLCRCNALTTILFRRTTLTLNNKRALQTQITPKSTTTLTFGCRKLEGLTQRKKKKNLRILHENISTIFEFVIQAIFTAVVPACLRIVIKSSAASNQTKVTHISYK